MLKTYRKEWEETITLKENLALIKKISKDFYKKHSIEECWLMSQEAWQSAYFQVQEIAVLLCGYIAHEKKEALLFLKETVSLHSDWRVQEVLAMSFDLYCRSIGYENALPIIDEWLKSESPYQRRAVSEGLRVWTSRPYFQEHPTHAIEILSALKEDESLYVRKSIGNSLRDISKKHPQLVAEHLAKWDLSNKKILQVYKLASRFLEQSSFVVKK